MQDEKLKTHNRYNPSSEIHSAEWVTQGAALTYLLCDSAKAAVSTMHRSAVGRRSIQSFHLIIPPLQLPAEHYPPPLPKTISSLCVWQECHGQHARRCKALARLDGIEPARDGRAGFSHRSICRCHRPHAVVGERK